MSARGMIGAVAVLLGVVAASGSTRPQEPGASGAPKTKMKPTASKPVESRGTPAEAVGRLVEQLRRYPVEPRKAPGRVALDTIDLTDGEVTLIADQPGAGLTYCGSPDWSHDGRRILFDATPGTTWSLTRLHTIEAGQGRPMVRDLGPGNCPTFAPADDRIAFLSNADGAARGIWLMQADG